MFGRRVRDSLQKGSQNRELQSGAIVIRNVVPNTEGVKFVPHESVGQGVFGRVPGLGEVQNALGRSVPRFGGNQSDKVGAVTWAGARARHRDRRPSSVAEDLSNCTLDRTPNLVLARSDAVEELRREIALELAM